jgi:hypothetical protein
MPSPSPGANTPSSSGNGAPRLLNDYVRLQAPLLCDSAHGSCLSNSVIASGKARSVRFIVCSFNLSTLAAVSLLVFRCPQLGHGGDCSREGDYVGQYTEGRDIPDHGIRSPLYCRSNTHSYVSPQSEIDLLKNLNVCVYIRSTPPADLRSASKHSQVQGILQDARISVHHPRVCHVIYPQWSSLDSILQVLREWIPPCRLQAFRKVPREFGGCVHMPGPGRAGVSSRSRCNTPRYQGREYLNEQGRLCQTR